MSIRRHKGVVPGLQSHYRIDMMDVTLSTDDTHTTSYDTVQYNVVNWDTGGWYDSTNYQWTPNVSGLYLHNFTGRWTSTEAWALQLYDATNTTVLLNKQRVGASVPGRGMYWSFQWWLEGGVAYELQCYTYGAGAIDATYSRDCRLQVVGPLST